MLCCLLPLNSCQKQTTKNHGILFIMVDAMGCECNISYFSDMMTFTDKIIGGIMDKTEADTGENYPWF